MNLKNQTVPAIGSCLKKTAENSQYVIEKGNNITHSNW